MFYEDAKCSNSFQPNYTLDDHSEYLGYKYPRFPLTSPVPITFLRSDGTVPPSPTFINDFTDAIGHFTTAALQLGLRLFGV